MDSPNEELELAEAISDLSLGLRLDRNERLGGYLDRDRDGNIRKTPLVK